MKILARGQHALRGGEFKAISKGRGQRHAGGYGAIQQGEGHAHSFWTAFCRPISALTEQCKPRQRPTSKPLRGNPASTSPAQGCRRGYCGHGCGDCHRRGRHCRGRSARWCRLQLRQAQASACLAGFRCARRSHQPSARRGGRLLSTGRQTSNAAMRMPICCQMPHLQAVRGAPQRDRETCYVGLLQAAGCQLAVG